MYPEADRKPAGFSSYWLQAVLRDTLQFTGAVFSDDLSMKGALSEGDVTERAHAALKAGCDMLILCNDFEASDRLLKTLQFEDTPEREERVRRLMPKGEALQWEALVNSALYKRSKALIPTE